MAAKNHTRNTQHQAGALAALEALRKADKAIEFENSADMELADCFAYRDATIANIVKASGVTDPHTAGFIACLAEMACSTMAGAVPAPEHWNPDTTMAPAELKAKRQKAIEFANGFMGGVAA